MVAVVVLDEDGRCNYLNAVAETLTGFGQSEAFGRPMGDILHLGGEDTFDETALGDAIRRREEAEGELGIVDPAGKPLPVAFRTVPLKRRNGEAHGTVVELIDLTGETGAGRALQGTGRAPSPRDIDNRDRHLGCRPGHGTSALVGRIPRHPRPAARHDRRCRPLRVADPSRGSRAGQRDLRTRLFFSRRRRLPGRVPHPARQRRRRALGDHHRPGDLRHCRQGDPRRRHAARHHQPQTR